MAPAADLITIASGACGSRGRRMPMWLWIAGGVGALLVVSAVVALAVAAALVAIGRKISQVHAQVFEAEEWMRLPPTGVAHATGRLARAEPEIAAAPTRRRTSGRAAASSRWPGEATS